MIGENAKTIANYTDYILWRVRSEARTPIDIAETWETVLPQGYDADGKPIMPRYADSALSGVPILWDEVHDTTFHSSLGTSRSVPLPAACPCPEGVEGGCAEASVAVPPMPPTGALEGLKLDDSDSSSDDE
jgi:hypothetical protein